MCCTGGDRAFTQSNFSTDFVECGDVFWSNNQALRCRCAEGDRDRLVGLTRSRAGRAGPQDIFGMWLGDGSGDGR
jgi:hypothetical protein